MPPALFKVFFGFLGKAQAVQEGADLSDGALLERFLAHRQEAAFEALVQRHGPMVLGVCQRATGDSHAAEDAFQATFLVLARRAASIHNQASVGSWLYGVAQRIARRARAQAAAQRDRERQAAAMRCREPVDEASWEELRPILDEEIGRLPEKCRVPLVLCYFEGKSYDQAAQELGWPKSSLASRLARGCDLLRQRLVKRGITLSATALTTALTESAAQASVAALLTINTVQAAASVAAGKTIAEGIVSARALALAEEATASMIGIKAKLALLLLALGLVAGVGFAGYSAWVGPRKADEKPPPAIQGGSPKKVAAGPGVDLRGDPLPAGAVARLGTLRFRHGGGVSFATFLPDGKRLLTAGMDATARVWEVPSGKELRHFNLLAPGPDDKDLPVKLPAGIATAGAAPNVAVSADGKTLAFLSEGSDRAQVGAVRVWDVETGKELWRRVGARWLAPGHDDCILCVTPSPDGKTLALRRRFRDKDGQPGRTDIEFWDVRKGEKVRTLTQQAPTGRVISSPDGKVFAELLGGGRGGPGGGPGIEPVLSLRLVDQENGRELGRINQAPWALPVFSPDGKTLAVRLAGGRLQLYEARTGKPLHQALDAKGVGSVAFTPDGKQLLGLFVQVGGAERVESPGFLVWDVATGRRVRDIGRPRKEIETNTWVGGSLAVSPDGTLAAFGGGDPSTVRLLDLKEGKEHPLPRGHTSGVSTIAFARDGKSITTYNYEGAYTWDAESGKLMARLRLPATDGEDFHHYSGGYDLSPDGSLFAALAGKRDLDTWEDKTGEIVLWDTRSGKEKKRIKSEPFGLDSGTFYFSADGKTLASPRSAALNQGKWVRLQLYDVATGKERLTLKLPAAPPPALGARL